jgi:recombinational DNA repair protein RecT
MSNLEKKLSKQELTKLSAGEITDHELVQAKFVDMYNQIHGSKVGEMIYAKETFNFKKLISESAELQKCTPISLYSVFLDIAMNGLSLEQGTKPLAYVISRNANVGTRENPQWEKRAYLVVSPYGELAMRMRAGHIRHADNPVIVYSGDTFSIYVDENGNKKIRYEGKIPREPNAKIVGSFIKLTRPDGSVDFEYLTMEDVDRLKGYSERNNKGKANALYSSENGQIDAGFLAGKTIKHAFRTYPKIRLSGIATITESELEAEKPVDYGIEIEKAVEVVDEQPEPEEVFEEVEDSEVF